MKNLVVLFAGGYSEERDISLETSKAIHNALLEANFDVVVVDPSEYASYLDLGTYLVSLKPYIVFNGLHGGKGEDGTIQAFLDLLNIPFTGSGMRASAITMDKIASSLIASSLCVKIAPYIVIESNDAEINQKPISNIGYPLVVKPQESGSSYGVSIVDREENLKEAIENAFLFSNRIICQKYIDGSELTVSILGNKALPIVEIKPNAGWYDYTNKYTKGKTNYIVPAVIPEKVTEELQLCSEKLFKEFGCKGYARIDYRYDGQDCYFLEVNTLPGMTSLSLTPMAAKEAGISFKDLICRIIEYSF